MIIASQCTNGANLHFLPGHGRGVGVYPVQANPQRSFLSQKMLDFSVCRRHVCCAGFSEPLMHVQHSDAGAPWRAQSGAESKVGSIN